MVYDYNVNKGLNNTVKRSVTPTAAAAPYTNNTVAPKTITPTSQPSSSYVPGSTITAPPQNTVQRQNNNIMQRQNQTYNGPTKEGLAEAQRQYKLKQLMEVAEQKGALPYGTAKQAFPSMDTDYAAEILKLQNQPLTAENQEEMRKLLAFRNWKIENDPEKYGKYEGDSVDRTATNYTQYIIPDTVDTDKYLNAMRNNLNTRYTAEEELAIASLRAQEEKAREKYEEMRKNSMMSAARNSLGNEEVLAAQGIGRGISNTPSSGFGESSRMMAAASLNNNLAASYRDEQNAVNELQRQYNDDKLKRLMQYAELASGIDEKGLTQANTDADRKVTIEGMNNDNMLQNRGLDIQEKGIENEDKQFYAKLDQDFAIHKDNLQLSREELDETRRSNMANEAIQQKQVKIDEEYKMGMLSVEEYVAKTNRMSALNKISRSGSSSGGTGYSSYASYTDPTVSAASQATPDAQVYAALSTGGKTGGLVMVSSLLQNGEINRMQAQNYIDSLGLANNDGWLK